MMTEIGIKYLSSIFFLICLISIPCRAQEVKAQIEEVKNHKRNAEAYVMNKTYRFTAPDKPDTVTIKVINPRGEMQALPVRKAPVAPANSLDFDFNTKHWIPGMYQVIAKGNHGTYTKQFRIIDPREP